jgi:K+ transporter
MHLSIQRNNNKLQLGIYRKPTQTDTTTHFTSNHPLDHKLAAHNFYINRMLSTAITEQARQQEWNTICTAAKCSSFPLQMIHNLRNKIIRNQRTKNFPIQTQKNKWIIFTYHSALIDKVINLFQNTILNITYRKSNNIYDRIYNRSP